MITEYISRKGCKEKNAKLRTGLIMNYLIVLHSLHILSGLCVK